MDFLKWGMLQGGKLPEVWAAPSPRPDYTEIRVRQGGPLGTGHAIWEINNLSNEVGFYKLARHCASYDAAKADCELTLIRLGLLPVLQWGGAPVGCLVPEAGGRTEYLVVNDECSARISCYSGAWEWKAKAGVTYARGAQIDREHARRTAEFALRALIVEVLELRAERAALAAEQTVPVELEGASAGQDMAVSP